MAATFAALVAFPALAETQSVIHASMWDNGADAMADFDPEIVMGYGIEGADMSKATMGITLDKSEVPAGDVTFMATNDSKDTVHEMIVAPITTAMAPLPYSMDDNRVDEDAAQAMGEVSETEPGDSGELTLHMAPGNYIVFCNIAGHYAMGMWTLLTVTE